MSSSRRSSRSSRDAKRLDRRVLTLRQQPSPVVHLRRLAHERGARRRGQLLEPERPRQQLLGGRAVRAKRGVDAQHRFLRERCQLGRAAQVLRELGPPCGSRHLRLEPERLRRRPQILPGEPPIAQCIERDLVEREARRRRDELGPPLAQRIVGTRVEGHARSLALTLESLREETFVHYDPAVARVELDRVSKVFPDGTRAVDAISLGVENGEFIVLVGPSGCGKTTALRMVAGLEEISQGVIRIGEQVVNHVPSRDRDIAMVFQSYALYPHLSVYENIAFGLRVKKVKKEEIDRRVKEAARILDLEPFLKRKPRALSGGQRQRVAMGRAIVRQPQAFLMDE